MRRVSQVICGILVLAVVLVSLSPFTVAQVIVSGGGGGITYGAASGGTATRVLFTDASGYLADDANFTFTPASDSFLLNGPTTIGGTGVTSTNKALIVNNGAATGNILEVQDNGTAVLTVADGGAFTSTVSTATLAHTANTLTLTPAAGNAGTITISSATGGVLQNSAAGTLTIKGGRGAAGNSNAVGKNIIIQAGLGTGNAAPTSAVVQTPVAGASGTTDQTLVTSTDWSQKEYAIADAVATNIFTVDLATADTGCGTHFSYVMVATDGTDTVTHMGAIVCAFANDDGTVTGACTELGETIIGYSTGCPGACDTWTPPGVVGTVATVSGSFNLAANLAGDTGTLRFSVFNNTCPSYTRQ